MDKILVLDFGGQYDQLIARRVREQQVFAEIKPYDRITPAQIAEEGYKGVIFTGGPNSVNDPSSPRCSGELLGLGIPVLGICYGFQLIAYLENGKVEPATDGGEYGKTTLYVTESPLFEGIPSQSVCWMSHTDAVTVPPDGFGVIARTASCSCAAFGDDGRRIYGVQFHPEVTHTEYGKKLLSNFVFGVCGCRADWRMDDFIERSVRKYREQLAGKKVLLGLSGGVDSAVAAVLLQKAIGNGLVCVFVDHGLLRKDEGDMVERTFRGERGIDLIRVNAADRFFRALRGVTEPEEKRKIIGREFVRCFEEEAAKLKDIRVLAQGTIYPDVIESGKGDSAVIKSHHNVGGLPKDTGFDEIVEPLRELFKDEVRKVGEKLGLPESIVWRQPFPGPGLGVRIIGEVTKGKAEIVSNADAIFREEAKAFGCADAADQYFAVLTGTRTVGVKGDSRAYGCTIALRAVTTDDFMTAVWARLPYELLERVSSRITNEIKEVTRVVYDITSKPPATVEWE